MLLGGVHEKKSLTDTQRSAAQRGGQCLSENYINSKTKLIWQCALEHKPFQMTPNNVDKGHWCRACAGNSNHTIEDMQTLAQALGGECLSTEYRGNKNKLEWRCNEGHAFQMRPNDVQQGHWCRICSGKPEYTIEDMQTLAKSLGGECLSTEYLGTKAELEWRCAEGHIFSKRPNTIQQP